MGEENTGAEDSTEKDSEEENQDDKSSGDQEQEGEDDKSGEDDKEKKQDKEDDEEPTVRKKTAKDYIIARKNKKIESLKNKKDENEDEQDEDDDVLEEDEKVIDKVIQKRYGDKFAKIDEAEDKRELDKFLSSNPDFKGYEKKIWKFWQHPSRNHLPVESVAYEVAGRDLLKIGAQRGKQADDKARQTSSGGGSTRNSGGKVDYASMTDKEFAQHVEEAKRK